MHSSDDLDKMLQNILDKIKEVLTVDGTSIALHDEKNKEFYFIQTVERQREGAKKWKDEMRFPDDYGVAGWVLREKQLVTIDDVAEDERFPDKLDIQQPFVTRSMICVPLRTRKGVIGVLYALNKKSGKFTPKDALLLEILSGTIAIAVENAKLYGEIPQLAKFLEAEDMRLKAEKKDSEEQDDFTEHGIIGDSDAMLNLKELFHKVVGTETRVLLLGETGTGKELLAKAIHNCGPLKDREFVAENCGALSENLIESELFGHVKGAFTGAIADKEGLFERAAGGTVFLDEISEMPYDMQTKLLRVLQEGQIRPVGGSKYRQVNFRLIASSNRDLLEEVNEGNFRADLFYRIQVFPIVLPPLRDKQTDIHLLATHFFKKFAKKLNKPVAKLTHEVLMLFYQYDWPGNVRQLENEIERALTLAGDDREITAEHISEEIKESRKEDSTAKQGGRTLKEKERQEVIKALRSTGGNRSHAARILGLSRQGLLNKIARYEIEL
jgi:Nif-specific regulatory protein